MARRARREFEKLDRLVTGLRPADWSRRVPRPEAKDPWTVKDALAHIVYWKEQTARAIRGEPRPAELRGLDITAGNRLVYRQWRDRRPSDVVQWHRRVQADLLRVLAEKPADWFTGRERGAPWPYDLDGHSAYHRLRDIEAAIGRTR